MITFIFRDAGEDLQVKIAEAKAQAQHYFESTKEYKKQLGASGIKKVNVNILDVLHRYYYLYA